MIHYLLYSVPNDKIRKGRRKYLIIFLISMFIMIFSFPFILKNKKIYSITAIVLFIIALIIFIANLVMIEKFKKRTVRNNYCEYNQELDNLRALLKNADYDDPLNSSSPNKHNWYTKDKIKHLIEEFYQLMSKKSKKNDPSLDRLKYTIIPVISFVGGAITEKAKLETTIMVFLAISFIIIFFWSINEVFIFFDELIFYNTSPDHIEKVYSLLKDLYIRDFDKSAPVNTNASAQSNTP